MIDILSHPRCRPEDLGKPIPESEHAVSVCLPLWRHNVGYEEADARVTERMQCGYPRFFLHPLVVRLFQECEKRFAKEGECCFAFPSQQVARRCADYLRVQGRHASTIHDLQLDGLHAICLPQNAKPLAMQFWQHSGEVVSSRQAAAALERRSAANQGDTAKQHIRARIAAFYGCDSDDVLLFPTGMAAIAFAHRVFGRLLPERKSIQFGFPYVDILKVQQRLGGSPQAEDNVYLFPSGDASELDAVDRLVANERVKALFCEIPGNPLLRSPDLSRLAELSARSQFPLLVDDTLGAFLNIDALPAADVVGSSLTKFFSGAGNVAAGSLVLSRGKPMYSQLKSLVLDEFEDLLYADDAVVLEQNSQDMCDRVRRLNRTTEQLCETLRQHADVERLYYPKYETAENYRACMRPDGGYGGLFSIDLRNAAENAPRFFDALCISKGPNLGTNFSLCCPYTILAHYKELEFAERCGVSRYLLRVSIGLEEPDWLMSRFLDALDRLH